MCSQADPRRVVSGVPTDRAPGTARGGPTDQVLPLVTRVLRPAEVTELRRRVAALPADCDTGLDRSTAYDVLSQLAELQARRKHGPNRVHCPYCGEGFDVAHGVTTRPPGWRRPPPWQPDPIGASASPAGAERTARELAKALAWGSRPNGTDAFWASVGQTVLWPLLWLGAATGADMAEVGGWSHPDAVEATMARVSEALDALDDTPDAELVREQWEGVRECRPQGLRTGFTYAHGMVRHWELQKARPVRLDPVAGGRE